MTHILFIKSCLAAKILPPVLVLCMLGALPLHAAENVEDLTDIPLEELSKLEVYSASKFSQKVSEAPASISIITATDIQRFGYRTFDDILRSVPGFYVTNDRNYAYLGIRGFGLPGDYNARILILIDGHRLNENIYGSTGVGTDFPISLDLIDRIEIVRGPGSPLYGTSAFLAVINVLTRRGRDFNGLHVSLEGGSRQTYQGTGTYGREFANGVQAVFSGSYMDSKGVRRLYFPEFNSPDNNDGIAQDGDTARSFNLFGDMAYKDARVRLVYQSREKRYPTAAYGTVFNDRLNNTADTRAYLELKFDHTFNTNWSLLTRSSLDAYEYRGIYRYDTSTADAPSVISNKDIASGRWWNSEAQVTRVIGNRHHVTAGAEVRYNIRARQKNFDETDEALYLDSNPSSTESGVYLQGEMAVRSNFLLSGGVRYDHYSTFGGEANPRFALIYSPWEKTTAKLLYGHAYRAPSAYEMFYQDGFSQKKNLALNPEKIRTLELVLEQYLTRKIRISAAGYIYRVRDQITQIEDPEDALMQFRNFGRVHARGIEVQWEGRDLNGLDAHISYMTQKATDAVNGIPLPNSPRHMAQMRLYFPAFKLRGGAGLEMQYLSSRVNFNNYRTGGFLLTNLTLTYRNLVPGLDLSAGLYNAFNRRYSDPGSNEFIQNSLQQDGRSFRVRLGYGLKAD